MTLKSSGREPHEIDWRHRGEEKHGREAGGQARARSSARQGIDTREPCRASAAARETPGTRSSRTARRTAPRRADRCTTCRSKSRPLRGSGVRSIVKKGNVDDRAEVDIAAALEEDAVGPGELLPDPDQILTLEREVAVAHDAVGEAVVGRLVSLERLRGSRKIDRHGKPRDRRRPPPSWPGRPDAACRPCAASA